ncbi:MAG: 2-succinyl-5-enolpyruvyl-6-hydroxy-3-cyclohexene-1-carboxylate synthase, partial [Gillisia sp.]
AKPLAEMYGFEYAKATSSEEVEKELNSFFSVSEKPKILEIFTPRKVNDEVLLEYFNFMKS